MKSLFLFACLLMHACAALAQGDLEIIPLKHRSAEQVIPVLRPLLESGDVLSGQGYQLFVRTSPRNLDDIRRTLAAIDTQQRRLMISVRFDSSADTTRSAMEASGTLRSGGQSHVDARIVSSRSASDERVDQRVQALEGGRAFISTGQTRPLPQRQVFTGPGGRLIQDSTVIQEAASGFEVVPQLSGNTVLLDIRPQQQRFVEGVAGSSGAANVQSQRASSSVRAQLGEWVELGGAIESASRASSGILSSRDARTSEARRVWVKVEELRP